MSYFKVLGAKSSLSHFNSEALQRGVEFELEADEEHDSSDESFDDEVYDNFKTNMMDLDGKRAKLFSGDKLPFNEIKQNMEPITEDGLVKKEILKAGTGLVIPDKSVVMMHYEGFLEERKEPFDSTRLRLKPYKFLLGDGDVLQGLDLGIQTMKKGEISRFIISPDYAFGPMGCPPRIPANAEVLYEVEIINFYKSKDAIEFEDMEPEDQRKAPFEKIVGVYECEMQMAGDLFRRKQYKPAIARYVKMKNIWENISVENQEVDEKRNGYLLKLYLNLAQCYLNVQNPRKAIVFSNLALKLDPDNVKGLYRMGCALYMDNEYQRGEYYLNEARKHKPYEKSINLMMQKLEQKRKRYEGWERMFYQNMFGSAPAQPKKPAMSKEMQEFFDIISEEVTAFVNSDEQEYVFSAGYTESQLEVVKQVAQIHDLAFVSKIMYGQKINKLAKKINSPREI